ncbi:GNAT family N-acetyltransferase [Psychromonas sp. psych-6C06]|uniref:GNAT family N-acetyltransferase n=1 Tax=Psychromonas sp. psych-6C06 TaxID=2058089 RepID=UPI000C3489D2|nr:GNAT family N-acetyltransferase [Psychromonas sp. psych-6C06]PKF63695.1 GNAT family N-acetyltransferase [Psychromonas sp. psych-6C06]
MQFIECNFEQHAPAMLAIFNDAIENSTALYDYKPRTIENMAEWFAIKTLNNFPVIGIVNDSEQLMGFASYGTFRAWPAYKYTVEHSLYVNRLFRGQKLGQALLEQLIERAVEQQYHTLIGAIDMNNKASIKLHEKFAFNHCGTIKQAAFKFGEWLDLGFYQRILLTPDQPLDG